MAGHVCVVKAWHDFYKVHAHEFGTHKPTQECE